MNMNAFPCPQAASPTRQRGAVLVVALIFLLLLTILALSSSTRSLLQLRMAGNLRSAEQAALSANTALRGVEWSLFRSALFDGTTGLICTDGFLSTQDNCVTYNAGSAASYGIAGVAGASANGLVTRFRDTRSTPGLGATYLGPAGTGYTGGDPTAQLAANPRYIIEDLGRARAPGAGAQREFDADGGSASGGASIIYHNYRVTVRARGGNSNALRLMESVFSKQR